jgi:beta-glucosidase
MPGQTRWRGTIAELAVSTRKVTAATLDERVRNILKFVKRGSAIKVSAEEGKRDFPEDRALNRTLAAASVVLLKNEKSILPLPKDITEIALIGPSLKNVAFCGGGSAQLEPYYTVSPYQGIVNKLPKDVKIHYEVGAHAHGFLPTLAAHITTPEGQPGARMRFFQDPPSVKDREIIDEVLIPDSIWQLMGYQHPRLSKLFYSDVDMLFTAPSTGEFEFGIAQFGTGNLYVEDRLIIDNTTVQRNGNSFFGKGTAEETGRVRMEEGKVYKVRMEFGSAITCKVTKQGVVSYGGGAGRIGAVAIIDEEKAIENAVKLATENKYTILCAGLSVRLFFPSFPTQVALCCNQY